MPVNKLHSAQFFNYVMYCLCQIAELVQLLCHLLAAFEVSDPLVVSKYTVEIFFIAMKERLRLDC